MKRLQVVYEMQMLTGKLWKIQHRILVKLNVTVSEATQRSNEVGDNEVGDDEVSDNEASELRYTKAGVFKHEWGHTSH